EADKAQMAVSDLDCGAKVDAANEAIDHWSTTIDKLECMVDAWHGVEVLPLLKLMAQDYLRRVQWAAAAKAELAAIAAKAKQLEASVRSARDALQRVSKQRAFDILISTTTNLASLIPEVGPVLGVIGAVSQEIGDYYINADGYDFNSTSNYISRTTA